MDFSGFDSMNLSPREDGLGFVYVLCWLEGSKEIPFYVGQTQAIWGRMNDYHWAEFQASTDFRVGEAVKYLTRKKRRIVAKYKASADRRKEEKAIICALHADKKILLNDSPSYDYRTATPDEERAKVQDHINKIFRAAGTQI
jgi:hypothetical protein